MKDYSFRQYLTRLTLWWRVCDVDERAAGPLVAARLQGKAYEVATKLRVIRNGNVYTADAALSLPTNGAGDPAGIGHLLARLIEEFQSHDQDYQNVVLDQFFDCRRNNRSLIGYITDFNMFLQQN